MKVYLDTSALLRLVDSAHPSHLAIVDYLDSIDGWERLSISQLNELEAERTAVREELTGNLAAAQNIRAFIAGFPGSFTPIAEDPIARAMEIPYLVKSLDAIHLGLAMHSGVNTLITYDQQMIKAANDLANDPQWKMLARFQTVSP